ncbi:TRAP transporter substrate-binding protein DctP [Telmatospirillum sp. J64-1]|uniref:TRAP transporter substrate-binding protein DctP n=1 Tax=Telmatospirillum sp. J64-1 TaxID=2502183 RepID=UPI00163DACC0|nr:TRAP transporter substrate-binding protein DctP [Telmatospirillum sp. J64-1]
MLSNVRKKALRMVGIASLGAATLTGGASFAAPASAEEVVLRTATALPRHHDLAKSFLDLFVERVNEVGKGVVRLDYIGGPEVTPSDRAAQAVQRGVIDLLYTPSAYHSGIVPQGSALIATNLTPMEVRENGGFDLLAPHWEQRLNSKLLAWSETGAQYHLYTKTEPPLKDGVFDLSGFRMRSTGAYRPILESLDATPVQIPAGDVLTGLERGVIDGFGWPTVGLAPLGLAGVAKYRLDPPFYHQAALVLINLDTWNKLPEAAQNVLNEVALEYERTSIDRMIEVGAEDAAAVQAAGITPLTLDEEGARAYLSIAYESMWDRVREQLGEEETAALREKLYQPD